MGNDHLCHWPGPLAGIVGSKSTALGGVATLLLNHDSNLVYTADKLDGRFPTIALVLRDTLGGRLRMIHGAKDIWCRDFMPVQVAPDRFVQFRYDPDYLKDDPHLRTEGGASLLNLPGCVYSKLIIDGGNIVRWRDAAIMTDKIYRENPRVTRPKLRRQLQLLLEVDRLIIIPTEPDDVIGHADGVVRFVNEKTVLLNDYRSVDPAYGAKVQRELSRFGIAAIPFPYRPSSTRGPDPDIAPATGCYINYLQTSEVILVPQFGLRADREAIGLLRRVFLEHHVIGVECTHLARHGGALNCVTWNVLH